MDMENIIRVGRASGNTTRQADQIIQFLFDNIGQSCAVIDHGELYRPNPDISNRLSGIVEDRLRKEHQLLPKGGRQKGRLVFEIKDSVYSNRGRSFGHMERLAVKPFDGLIRMYEIKLLIQE